MAGGRGERLGPLTAVRSKPAVPIGGRYRIVDFVLSNFANSEIGAIYVLTQYKAQSLVEHLQRGWSHRRGRDEFITAVAAQMQAGEVWYRGTADAVYQNWVLVREFRPDIVAVFGADHVYKMDVRQMIDFHEERGSKATVACLPVPVAEARGVGIVEVDPSGRVTGFQEKPEKPREIPGRPGVCLASMGNYVFDARALEAILREDSDAKSSHDFGKDIFPRISAHVPVYAYDFSQNRIPGTTAEGERAYWRDVGTVEAYFEANLDLKNVVPRLNLYNWEWPIRTAMYGDPPVKFVFDEEGRRGAAVQSVVSGGCILAGGYVKDSVLGRHVLVDAGADVREAILFDNVVVGPGARVRRAILDKNVRVPPGVVIGEDPAADRARYWVSPGGIVVIPKAEETPETLSRNW